MRADQVEVEPFKEVSAVVAADGGQDAPTSGSAKASWKSVAELSERGYAPLKAFAEKPRAPQEVDTIATVSHRVRPGGRTIKARP
jgi:hypothetical protein